MGALSQRAYGRTPRQGRSSRVASSWSRVALAPRVVGVCVLATAMVALVLLLASSRGRVAPRRVTQSVPVQRRVAALFAGIPQQGVVLGRPAAPVTLQVFVDLEDQLDANEWFDVMLPSILEEFVRTGVVRLEFRSFKTDTLNGGPFVRQQTAALAAGAQDRLWNYAATFIEEQGREFTNYATEAFVTHIAEQVPGLNMAEWERSRTAARSKLVMADNYDARYRFGFYATPAFRIGLTGGHMKDFSGHTVVEIHKYIVRRTPSGERYIAGVSNEWQHPVSLIDASDLEKALGELCQAPGGSCPAPAAKR